MHVCLFEFPWFINLRCYIPKEDLKTNKQTKKVWTSKEPILIA